MSLKKRRVMLILLVLFVLVNSSPLILKVPGIDSGIFLYTARQMLKVWKNKDLPPSIQAFFDFVAENYVQTENESIYRYVGK